MPDEKRKRGRPPAKNDTRERILKAAIKHFSKYPYEQAGLREIAAAANVDVAYVHRCFGSKKRLFAEVVSEAVKPKELFKDDSVDQTSKTLVADLMSPGGTRDIGLKIILNSLASREAGPIVRDFYVEEVVQPLAAKLGVSTMRAGMIAALITGVATLRNLVSLAPLCEPQGGDLERLLIHLIREAAKDSSDSNKGTRDVRK
jgi:AcrR family transcriptional regulator